MKGALGIIPARGGSKGIPYKNIHPLCGKPLLWYAISEAHRCRYLDRVVVSTDDEKIAEVARQSGAEVVMRPAALATDESPTELALLHVVESLKDSEGYEPTVVVTLEPTSPLRSAELIDRCLETLQRVKADSVMTVVETRDCFGTVQDGYFTALFANQPRRRQDRQPLYRESGTLYATRLEALKNYRSVLGGRPYAVIIDEEEAIDINTTFDLIIAEALMQHREKSPT
ncbi:MAG: acylneuraminate cytidylyltransferase family protein [Candidatus Omnitrophica bacterium]|nr:acylneuraminate cytidylyltransferase family protein [Candidatus Omnitrophota bacterium]MBI3010228.1 acylneuraminate cytidylyltransferase family protein [Candidatus Omnitrophota bacterium]